MAKTITSDHTHQPKDELAVLYIPADERLRMEMRVIKLGLGPMQRLVGGYLEQVWSDAMPVLRCGCRTVLMVNEEAKISGREQLLNPRATPLLGTEMLRGQYIAGNVFLVGQGLTENGGFPEMDFVSLPQEFTKWKGPGHKLPKAPKITRLAKKGKR